MTILNVLFYYQGETGANVILNRTNLQMLLRHG